MNFDIIIVGNGILGLTLANEITSLDKGVSVALVGPKDRMNSASKASGAMLAAYGEIEEDSLSYKPYKDRFKIIINALNMWPKHLIKLQEESGQKIQSSFGTYIINSSRGTVYEDKLIDYIKKSPKKMKDNNNKVKDIIPSDIPGIKTRPLDRPTEAVHVNDGLVNSNELLSALDSILTKNKNINIIDKYVKKLDIKKKFVGLDDNNKIFSNNIVLANGSFTQDLVEDIKELSSNIPKLLFGVGAGLDMKLSNLKSNFVQTKDKKDLFKKSVIRTVDRGGACGVHFIPFDEYHSYLGASSAVFKQPEIGARSSSIGFLLNDAINQISPLIGRSNIKEVKYGFRPVSEDTFPLLGETHIKGIWYLNGMKRDGLTASPYICKEIAKNILKNKKNRLLKNFQPSRNLISYFNKKKAIGRTVLSKFNRENAHGAVFSDLSAISKFMHTTRLDIERIYKKLKITKFGIHPELIDLYDLGQINKSLIRKK
mgnify:CR=1 FL=1